VGALDLTVDAIHLAAVSFWPGGLVFFALLLRSTIALPLADLGAFAARATYRFSVSSLLAVAVLSTTGLANSLFVIHDVHELWTTAYGQLLGGKVLLFLVTVAIGAWNLLVLKRKVGLEGDNSNVGGQTPAVRALFRNLLKEVALAAVIILVVAVLGITEPPRH
jgi:copper resistance protein D